MTTDCLVRFEPRPDADVALVAIPWAGSGAAPFHSWTGLMPPNVELVAVRLAGRERRLRQPPSSSLDDVVAELTGALVLLPQTRVVLFGHCLGAILAFEVARSLARSAAGDAALCGLVCGLVVVGSPAPRWLEPGSADGDGDLVEELRQAGLTDEALLADERMFAMLRPAIEADRRLAREYRYRAGPPLDVPVTVLAEAGDPVASTWVTGWADEVHGRTDLRYVPDGCMYPGDAWPALGAAVAAVLSSG